MYQSRPQSRAIIASPVVGSIQHGMPVPVGGFGIDHHFPHQDDCETTLTESILDVPNVVGHFGSESKDSAIAS